MGKDKGGTFAGQKKGRGKAKWMALGVLGLAFYVALEAGYVGFGWAHLMAGVFPRDQALLSWVPGDTGTIAILDPHQIDTKALGGEESAPRTALMRTRDDVKKATGIDLAFDADKLVLTPALVVARGRFDVKKLTERLAEHRYVAAEHKGVGYLVRPGEDAIGVVDGQVLLYGDEAGIKAAIEGKQGGTSLEKNEALLDRLKNMGWDRALVVSVRVTDDKPSVRAILAGSTGPRAVTVGVSTKGGLDVDAIVDSTSPGAADELRKLLEEKRAAADTITQVGGPELGPLLADVAKKATITAAESAVKIHAHLEPAQLDAIAKSVGRSPLLTEYYKTLRLYQLLAPGG